MKNRRLTIILLFVLLVLGVLIILSIVKTTGAAGLFQFNHYSVLRWKLGEEIEGIDSAQDAKNYDHKSFEYFSDSKGEGIKMLSSDTRYYLGEYRGDYCVVGFSSDSDKFSVMSVRVGYDESSAKSILFDESFSAIEGKHNFYKASNGAVTVELELQQGEVVRISAYID